MKKKNKLQIILAKIRNFFVIIITLLINFIRSLFNKKKNVNDGKIKVIEIKKANKEKKVLEKAVNNINDDIHNISITGVNDKKADGNNTKTEKKVEELVKSPSVLNKSNKKEDNEKLEKKEIEEIKKIEEKIEELKNEEKFNRFIVKHQNNNDKEEAKEEIIVENKKNAGDDEEEISKERIKEEKEEEKEEKIKQKEDDEKEDSKPKEDKEADEKKEDINPKLESAMMIKSKEIVKSTGKYIKKVDEDLNKAEFEDRDYSKHKKELKDMLEKLSDLKRRKKINDETCEEMNKIVKEKISKIEHQYDRDKNIEISTLYEPITVDMASSLYNALVNQNREQKADNMEVISNLSELNLLEDEELLEKKEKKLIMKGFRRAFVKNAFLSLRNRFFPLNKYFNYYSEEVIREKYLNDIKSIFRREEPDVRFSHIENISTGADAFFATKDLVNDNIGRLDDVSREAILRHPELANSIEFKFYTKAIHKDLDEKKYRLKKKESALRKDNILEDKSYTRRLFH